MVKQDLALHETRLNETSPNSTTRQKLKSHFQKWWWAYLLIFILLVLIIILPIVYVGYPTIAQQGINSSQLLLSKATLSNPSPEAFDLDLYAILLTDSKFHPFLDSFNASLHVSHDDDGDDAPPFAYINVPAMKAKNQTLVHLSQRVRIADQEEFAKFCMLTLGRDVFTIGLRGKGGLKLGGLPRTKVEYRQPVEWKGLNSLTNLTIPSFQLNLNSSSSSPPLPANGNKTFNSNATISLPNPSPLTLSIGSATFDVLVNNMSIATATTASSNLTLDPGENFFGVNVQSNLSAVTTLLALPAFRCGVLPVEIRGINSTTTVTTTTTTTGDEGQVLLPYFTAALRKSAVKTSLDLGPALRREGLQAVLTGDCVG